MVYIFYLLFSFCLTSNATLYQAGIGNRKFLKLILMFLNTYFFRAAVSARSVCKRLFGI
ncbi:hypothetical protein DESC_590162 [Desulfosarcina cetonica]|nr:hypothetical protein DESC_590162 [Desulfosarcina cetonica]